MKKLAMLATLLIVAITNINAQESAPTELVSNHSINTNFTGVDYSFEHKIGGKFAMNYSAALGSNIIISDGDFYYSLIPYIIAEPRYYYNLNKRALKGKSTYKNSASYIALKSRLLFSPIYANNEDMENNTEFQIAPVWGIKRVYGDHFLMDVHIGLGIAAGRNEFFGAIVMPKLFSGIKLGYIF